MEPERLPISHYILLLLFIILSFGLITVFHFYSTFYNDVFDLPGLSGPLNFKHYSGYLNASDTHFLHYWFVESQSYPHTDPIIVWLNGGPGCSSLDGLLSEMGPFLVNDDGKSLRINSHSWNKEANILFLESPAGVGFSYSTDDNVTTDDDQVSRENYEAVKHFFEQYPQYKLNNLYIFGESYGGIYAPTLAVLILKGLTSYPLQLKGVAVGNGMLDWDINTDTMFEFAYSHGMIDQKIWDKLQKSCCQGGNGTCNFHEPSPGACKDMIGKSEMGQNSRLFHSHWELNWYDIYQDCYVDDSYQNYFSYQKSVGYPCIDSSAITNYLNRNDVRKALSIPETVPQWEICSSTVHKLYKKVYKSMKKQILQLMASGLRILVYNGDTDLACNFLMGQTFVAQLNQTLLRPNHPWRVNGQIAGYSTTYKNIDFFTIKVFYKRYPSQMGINKPSP